MQPHRFDHSGGKLTREPGGAKLFVPAIEPVVGEVLRQSMQEVAEVVQAPAGDKMVRCVFLFTLPGSLQCVFELRDRLAEVGRAAIQREQIKQFVNHAHDVSVFSGVCTARRWLIRKAAAATLESSATPERAVNAPCQP